jgi:hypothetical protein
MPAKKNTKPDVSIDITPVELVAILGYLLGGFDDPSVVDVARKGQLDEFKITYTGPLGERYLFQNVLIDR